MITGSEYTKEMAKLKAQSAKAVADARKAKEKEDKAQLELIHTKRELDIEKAVKLPDSDLTALDKIRYRLGIELSTDKSC